MINEMIIIVLMRTDLLTNTNFGKYYPTQNNTALKTVQLDKIQEIKHCKLTAHH